MNKRHLIMLALGCFLPLLVLGAFFLFGFSINLVALAFILFLCPLMHFIMMKTMHQHGHEVPTPSHQGNHSHETGA